jgi:hypothetical protein
LTQGVDWDLPAPAYMDRFDLACGEEFIQFAAADPQRCGCLADRVDESVHDWCRIPGSGTGVVLLGLCHHVSAAAVCLRITESGREAGIQARRELRDRRFTR